MTGFAAIESIANRRWVAAGGWLAAGSAFAFAGGQVLMQNRLLIDMNRAARIKALLKIRIFHALLVCFCLPIFSMAWRNGFFERQTDFEQAFAV